MRVWRWWHNKLAAAAPAHSCGAPSTAWYPHLAAWPFGAAVAKLAYAAGLKSAGVFPVVGSSPTSRTSFSHSVKQILRKKLPMRVTISHDKTKQEVIDAIDRSFAKAFEADSGLPAKLTVQQKSWQGSTLTFAITAKVGPMSSPIKGTVDVGDHDLTIDADLGMLGNFVSESTAREMIGGKIKGLLK
jgi:hypothetical protein